MWTASGYYMALNSNETTVGRNSAILWMLSMTAYGNYRSSLLDSHTLSYVWPTRDHCEMREMFHWINQSIITSGYSNILGGIYLLIMFSVNDASQITECKNTIDNLPYPPSFPALANILYGTFCGVAFVGNIVFLFTRSTPKEVGSYRTHTMAVYFRSKCVSSSVLTTWKNWVNGLSDCIYRNQDFRPSSLIALFTFTFYFSSQTVWRVGNPASKPATLGYRNPISRFSWHFSSAVHMEDGFSRRTVCIHRTAHVILECGERSFRTSEGSTEK